MLPAVTWTDFDSWFPSSQSPASAPLSFHPVINDHLHHHVFFALYCRTWNITEDKEGLKTRDIWQQDMRKILFEFPPMELECDIPYSIGASLTKRGSWIPPVHTVLYSVPQAPCIAHQTYSSVFWSFSSPTDDVSRIQEVDPLRLYASEKPSDMFLYRYPHSGLSVFWNHRYRCIDSQSRGQRYLYG